MDERTPKPAGATNAAPGDERAAHDAAQKDHFLKLMFFQGHRAADAMPAPRREPVEPRTGGYAPLPHSTAKAGERLELPVAGARSLVHLESPASDVMTDLRMVNAVTVDAGASVVAANRLMIARGVRALFVADETHRVQGVITSTDILGERPVKFAQERGLRHDELAVRDIMTPAEQLELMRMDDVAAARVGDIVATLKLSGRQHALAVEPGRGPNAGSTTVCGIFSLTQIARQLGIAPQQVHDIARTFAEIEAAIAS